MLRANFLMLFVSSCDITSKCNVQTMFLVVTAEEKSFTQNSETCFQALLTRNIRTFIHASSEFRTHDPSVRAV
jgi:hypothetical protein